jgi:hypothetical protein
LAFASSGLGKPKWKNFCFLFANSFETDSVNFIKKPLKHLLTAMADEFFYGECACASEKH